MQHLNNQLKVAFFITLFYWTVPFSMYAQDGRNFKYKVSKHKGERLVTLTLPESVARELLAALLEEDNREEGPSPKEARTYKAYKVYPIHKKVMPIDPSPSFEAGRQVMRSMIGEMIRDSIVKDRDSFTWFALDGQQFVVDGKAMPDSLRVRFQSEYIKADGWGYYFGPVEVKGRGIFMDRDDVY
jgi:hypothetical protein